MEKKKVTKGTKKTIIIYLAVIAVLGAIIYGVPQVTDIFKDTYIAEYGTLQISDEAECVFVREEKVHYASAGGTVKKEEEAGELVRKGSSIVNVGASAHKSSIQGLVSYWCDGYEESITPDKLKKMDKSIIDSIKESEEHDIIEIGSGTAAAGDPVFKIVDNHEWYLVCWLDSEKKDKYSEGKEVTVDFDMEDSEDDIDGVDGIKMTVSSVTDAGEDEFRLILVCNRYYEEFDKLRISECRIITSNKSGILLETDSIVEKDGQKGVYVMDIHGEGNFTPVLILADDGETCVVEKNFYYDAEGWPVETVINYDEILRQEVD